MDGPEPQHSEVPTVDDRRRLAERYIELGLDGAARPLLLSLLADAPELASWTHVQLCRLCLDRAPGEALDHARRALAAGEVTAPVTQGRPADAGEPATAEPLSWIGRAALASDDLELAERSFDGVLEAAGVPAAPAEAPIRARALLGLAVVARERQDKRAAAARLRQLVQEGAWLGAELLEDVVDLARVCDATEGLLAASAAAAASADAVPAADPAARARLSLLRGWLLESLGARPPEVEAALELARRLPAGQLAFAVALARRRGSDQQARRRAVEELRALLERDDLHQGGVSPAQVYLLLASIEDDDPERGRQAAALYERALAELPRDAFACNNLGVIALREGDFVAAERWLLRALVDDPLHEKSYLNLARLLYIAGSPQRMVGTVERMLLAGLGARCLANLSFALIEVAREDAHLGMADRGHQLKNLLGVAATRARGLVRRAGAEERPRIERLAERLAGLYDEFATYLRTMREEASAVASIEPNELVAEAARRSGGRVHLRLADRLPEIGGVRDQLLEALVNLIRNGLESRADEAEVLVETRLGRAGRVVLIAIEDRGPGIPPTELRRVFAPGYTTKREGSGLGLSISERVVRAHSGHIEIESNPGEGTRVQISLPVERERELRLGLGPSSRVARAATAEEYVLEE